MYGHGGVLDINVTKSSARLHSRDGGNFLLRLVKSDGRVDITIGHSITVSKQKRVLLNEFQRAFQPAIGHRGLPGIYQGYIPVLFVVLIIVLYLRPRAEL